MPKLFQRFSEAIEAGKAASEPDQATPPAMTLAKSAGQTKRYMLALILGQSPEEALTTAATLRNAAKEKNLTVVLATDQPDIATFQIEGCITEYLPPLSMLDGRASRQDIETYLERRLGILIEKWEPLQTIPFGADSEKFHNLWLRNIENIST